jgi:hypothetical protein
MLFVIVVVIPYLLNRLFAPIVKSQDEHRAEIQKRRSRDGN